MAYGSDIDTNLSPNHRWSFDGDVIDTPGTADGTNTGCILTDGGICMDTTNCLTSNAVADQVTLPTTTTINNAAQGYKTVAGWFATTAIQNPPKNIYGEGDATQAFRFILGWGNYVVFEVDDPSFTLQIFGDVALEVNRPYHFCMLFEGNTMGNRNELRAYLDGVEQLNAEPTDRQPDALTLTARSVGEFGDPAGTVAVGGVPVILISPINGKWNEWCAWDGAGASLTEAQIRIELFERGALPDITISSDTEVNMQTALDVYADTVRGDAPLCIRVEAVTGDGDLELTADNITFNALASIHVQYMGTGTLTWINANGSNAAIVSELDGTIVIENPASLTINGLIDGCEVRVYDDESTTPVNYFDTELDGIETLTGTTFVYNHPGVANTVLIQMMAFGYVEILQYVVLDSSDLSVTLFPIVDINAADAKLILKGYMMGGYTATASTAVIEDLIFSNETSQVITATLDTANFGGTGVSSSLKGYMMGGYSTATVIEDLIFLDETSQAISATLDTGQRYSAGVNSSTKGYIMGGYTGSGMAVIEDLIFLGETSQAITATLDTAKYNGTGVNSSLKGYIMGGDPTTAVIEDLIFLDDTSQALTATLDTAKYWGTGVNSSTKGYMMGGSTAVIEDLIFATETSQVITATLDADKNQGVGVNSSAKGYIMGGIAGSYTTAIEDLTFSNETTQIITATLDTAKYAGAGVQSGWLPSVVYAIPKGYYMGGKIDSGPYTVIEDLVFSDETSQVITAALDTAKSDGAGVSSSAKGYIMGGSAGSSTAVIEDLIFLGETSQAITATLDAAKHGGVGVSSSTKGYIMGGFTRVPTLSTAVIEDLIFSNETSQAIAATLDTAKLDGTSVNSSLKGYIMGGIAGSNTAVIEDLIFSNETSQAIAATLDTAKRSGAGVSSSSKGYMMGGNPGTAVIEDLIFSNETSQAITATLDTAKYVGTGVSSPTKGYYMGGIDNSWLQVATIEDLIFATEASQAITATLDTAKHTGAGVQSGQ